MTTPILEPKPSPDPPTPDSLEGWMDLLTWPSSTPPRDPFPGPQTPDPGPLPKPGPSAPGR
jgi:hypothetical protein